MRDFSECEVLAVLERLERTGIECWVDGGWGIDALLGVQTRPHRDLDLVLDRAQIPSARRALIPLGYERDDSVKPGWPARCPLRNPENARVDLHPVVFDAHGHGWQQLDRDAWGQYPADGLTATGEIAGKPVRCLTPQLQLRHRLGYPLQDEDHHDLQLLAKRFGLALPPDVSG